MLFAELLTEMNERGEPMRRLVPRDVQGAENIAFKTFARFLGIEDDEMGMFSRHAWDDAIRDTAARYPGYYTLDYATETPPSWTTIYGDRPLPFIIRPPLAAQRQPPPQQQ